MSLDAEWCDHCEMVKMYCPHGNPGVAKPPRPLDCTEGEDGPTIEASIPGECATCGDRIAKGDRITHVLDGWVHAAPERKPSSSEGLFDGDF